MRYVSIDIETTGLDPDTCDIIEFGAIVDDLTDIVPVETLPKFHCYFLKPTYSGEPFALSMHPHIFKRIANREDGWNYMSATKFGNAFKKFLVANGHEEKHDKVTITVAGKNFGAFDLQFLNKHTDLSKHVQIRHKILDPAILYIQKGDDVLPGLAECKIRAGLGGNVSHNALDDARDVVKLIRKKLQGRL